MKSKKLIFGIIAFVSAYSLAFSIQPEKSTDKLLYEHLQPIPIKPFQELFKEIKIHSFLEFGINSNTQYFLNNCSTVTSCEIILPHQTDAWVQKTHKPFKKYKNWTSIIKKGSWNLYNAHIISSKTQKDPSLFDSTYLLDIKEICEMLFKDNSFEMVLVPPSFPMKGDLINELFDHAPIIAAYQTDSSTDLCDWNKIHTPSNYEKIIFTQEQEKGLIFWVHKDKTNVIKILCKNPLPQDKIPQKKNLRIFFPQMHPILVQSMVLTLQYLGHTLVLPGESFDPKSSHPGLKISYGTFFKKNPLDSISYTNFFSESSEGCNFLKHNVEVIENDELLTHPPDVLCVNCLEVEKSIYKIWKCFIKKHQTPPKLVHYSGNNHSRYKAKYVKNLIAVDAYTANYFDRNQTNIIFWIPWIDFESFKFEDFDDSSVINSYIAHQYKFFQPSAEIFNCITDKLKMDFPEVEIHSYPNQALPSTCFPHNQVPSLFNKSSATLHIKETEGFGYTIIQSLAKGRPVFLKRSFSLGSRMMNWCIEGRTAFFFDDYSELQQKLHRYLTDREHRHQVQKDCAQIIRKIIDNEKQARILDNFLQNLE